MRSSELRSSRDGRASRGLLLALLACGLACGATVAAGGNSHHEKSAAHVDAAPARRFFLSGDGELSLRNFHTGQSLHVRFRERNGAYSDAAMRQIDELFRSQGDDRRIAVSLRLVELIDYLEDHEQPKELLLMSGYRSAEYNAAIRARGAQAAKASLHTEGLAADLRFVGVDQSSLWQQVRALECCGAGYYASGQFLHLDVGRPRFWEETTSRVKENLSGGNARVFARTDFDRYPQLDGAVVSLHAVTLRPLRIATHAELVPEPSSGSSDAEASSEVVLEPVAASAVVASDGCLEVPSSDDPPPVRLRVSSHADRAASARRPAPGHAGRHGRIVLHTCAPRLEKTPETIETNRIEIPVGA
jgi:uncharacterized protein YcbK (DUF882 family)